MSSNYIPLILSTSQAQLDTKQNLERRNTTISNQTANYQITTSIVDLYELIFLNQTTANIIFTSQAPTGNKKKDIIFANIGSVDLTIFNITVGSGKCILAVFNGTSWIPQMVPVLDSANIALNGSNDLQVTLSGSLTLATYCVYDWQRSSDGGSTWNSTAVANLMFAETSQPTKDYSSYNQAVTIVGSPVYGYNSGDGNGGYTYPNRAGMNDSIAGLRLTHNSNLSLENGASTIFIRYKITQTNVDWWHAIFAKQDTWGGEYTGIHHQGGTIRLLTSDYTGYAINNWVTVAQTWSANSLSNYVNGVLKTSGISAVRTANTHSLDIGYIATPGSGVGSIGGIVSEVIVYRYVLSANQIAFLHNKERNKISQSDLTSLGGKWRVRVTPITNGVAGSTVVSNVYTAS